MGGGRRLSSDNGTFVPRVYNTLNVPLIQLIFANLYLGIAEGALATAATYTRDRTRPWPYTPDLKTRGSEEFYVLETYGDLRSRALGRRGSHRAGRRTDRADQRPRRHRHPSRSAARRRS